MSNAEPGNSQITALSTGQRWIAYISGGLLGLGLALAVLAIFVAAYL